MYMYSRAGRYTDICSYSRYYINITTHSLQNLQYRYIEIPIFRIWFHAFTVFHYRAAHARYRVIIVVEKMSEEQDLVSKRNTTSAVWQYFGFIPDEEGRPKDDDKPVCKLCRKTVK